MTYAKRPRCRRCLCAIRKNEEAEPFLMPHPSGEIRWARMHLACLRRFNAQATTEFYSNLFMAKRKAFLRTTGVYCA